MFRLQYRVLLRVDHAALSTFCFVCLLHLGMGVQLRTISSMSHPIEYQQGSPGCCPIGFVLQLVHRCSELQCRGLNLNHISNDEGDCFTQSLTTCDLAWLKRLTTGPDRNETGAHDRNEVALRHVLLGTLCTMSPNVVCHTLHCPVSSCKSDWRST
jgi:hypothetical protein